MAPKGLYSLPELRKNSVCILYSGNINLVRLLQLFCNLPNILGSTLGTSLLPFYVARFKYHHVLHEARGYEDFKQLTRVRESCKISKITVFAISVILQDNKPNEVLSQVSEVKKGKFCFANFRLSCTLFPVRGRSSNLKFARIVARSFQ